MTIALVWFLVDKFFMMTKIFVLSGLGVDKRVFNEIDFKSADVTFVDWVKPFRRERISDYAKRIAEQISGEDIVLVGLSFGGMMAVELSKIINVRKIILIASAKNKEELPFIYRFIGKMRLNKIFPSSLLKTHNFLTNWFFGIHSFEHRLLMKNILKDTDSCFLRWAINEIVNWQNVSYPENCIHIHGSKDRIIPIKNCKVDYIINDGGHFMTVNKPREIEVILEKELHK